MTTAQQPCAQAHMLIRKPVAEVFNAFIDPNVTTPKELSQQGN